MRSTPARPSRASAWLLTLVVGAVALSLVGGAVYFWLASAGMAPLPAALATPRPPASTAPRPIPVRDPKATAAELLALAPELTPASAALLVSDVPNATGPGLADLGLVVATRGFDQMERDELAEMAALIEEAYATLPPGDHAWMGEYMRMLRDGSLAAADGVRGRRLLTQGVNALAPPRRERLQALMETAIRAGLKARRRDAAPDDEPAPSGTSPSGPALVQRPLPPVAQGAQTLPSQPGGAVSAGNGHGEAYWRSQMQAARARVAQLKGQIEALDKEAAREAQGPGPAPVCPKTIPSTPQQQAALDDCLKTRQNWHLAWQVRQGERAQRLTQLQDELAAAQRGIGDVEDEARRDGALPGWLRE